MTAAGYNLPPGLPLWLFRCLIASLLLLCMVIVDWPDVQRAIGWARRRRDRLAAGPKPQTPSPAFLEGGRWVVACPGCRQLPMGRFTATVPGRGCRQCIGYGTLPVVRLCDFTDGLGVLLTPLELVRGGDDG